MPKKRANGEGSLRKRKDGRWEGRYTAGNDPATGKPIHKSVLAKTQAEAKEKLKQAIAEAEKLDMSRANRTRWARGSSCGTRYTPSRACGRKPKTTTSTTSTTTLFRSWAVRRWKS